MAYSHEEYSRVADPFPSFKATLAQVLMKELSGTKDVSDRSIRPAPESNICTLVPWVSRATGFYG